MYLAFFFSGLIAVVGWLGWSLAHAAGTADRMMGEK